MKLYGTTHVMSTDDYFTINQSFLKRKNIYKNPYYMNTQK